MSELVKTAVPGLARDIKTGALINNDMNALAQYKARRAQMLGQKNENAQLMQRIEKMEAVIGHLVARIEELEKRTD
jgi:hypothetical protein